MKHIFVYGTVLNNAPWVKDCLNSVLPLNPIRIVIVDNGSTDGTVNIIREMQKQHTEIQLIEGRYSRGAGRQRALDEIYKYANNNDVALYIDLDTVYSNKWIKKILSDVKTIKNYKMGFAQSQLCTIKTNKLAKWRDLYMAEDWERLAHLQSCGVKGITYPSWKNMAKNRDEGSSWSEREKYYTKSYITLFNRVVDEHRGTAYKNWSGSAISPGNKIINIMAHFIALIKGVYSYNKNLDNKQMFRSKYNSKNVDN